MKNMHKSILTISAIALFTASSSALAAANKLYSVSNKQDANTVVVYQRNNEGKFAISQEIRTGGKGTGDLEIPALKKDPTHPLMNGDDPLISANAIAQSDDDNWIVVVNPGDASVSLLAVRPDGKLKRKNNVSSSDKFPVSVAIEGNLVAVASVGDNNGAGSIGLMEITENGMIAVSGSRRDLNARPSTIDFSTDGKYVVVNELVTGKIKIFAVENGNLSSAPVSEIDSPRDTDGRFQAIPVGFTIHGTSDGDVISVSEARFLTPDFLLRGPTEGVKQVVQSPLYTWQTGSLSTYRLAADGNISLISGDVLTGAAIEGGELANCWVVLSPDSKRLWAVNAMSSSISSFRIRENGTAALVNDKAFKIAGEQSFFSDIAISDDGKEIYQLVGNQGAIMIFDVAEDGNLKAKQTVGGLPVLGAFGLIAD